MTALGMLVVGLGILLLWASLTGRDPRKLVAGVIAR